MKKLVLAIIAVGFVASLLSGNTFAGEEQKLNTQIVRIGRYEGVSPLNLIITPGTVVVGLNDYKTSPIEVKFPDKQVTMACQSPVNFSISKEGTKVLISEDTANDPRVNTEISSVTGSRSMIVVPLVHQDRVGGVLKVVALRPRAFDDLDSYSLQLMAGFIAVSLAQAEQYRAEIEAEKRFRILFERNIAAAFFTTPEGKVVEVNDALVRMLGFSSRDEALDDRVWSRYEKESDRKEMLELLRDRKSLNRHNVRLLRQDGSVLAVLMNIDMVRTQGGTILIGTMLEAQGT